MQDNKEFSKTCVEFEMEKHPWLSDAQAKRIVEDNLQDDPDFYAFLYEDEDEIVEEEEYSSDQRELSEPYADNGTGKEKTGPTLIEVSFGLPVSNKD